MKTRAFPILIACFAGLFLFLENGLAQSQFYVSPAGSDANPGTLNLPWQTIQHALGQAVPGTTIYLMGGTYNENAEITVSGINGHPITLTNYNNQNAVLSGASLSGGPLLHIGNASWIIVSGLEFAHYAMNDAQGILVDGVSSNIQLLDNSIHDIHFSGNTGDVPNAGTNAQPLIVYGDQPTPVSSIIISGNHIYNCRTGYSEALAVNGNVDGFTISGNEVHDITNIGIDVIGHEGVCAVSASDQARNGTVKWNRCWNCISPYATSAGIYVDGGRNCVIENNTTYGNGWGIEVGCESAGDSASGIIVRNNLVYGNEDGGIAFGGYDFPSNSGKISSCRIVQNTIVDNSIAVSGTANVVISYCENTSFTSNIVYSNSATVPLVSAPQAIAGLSIDKNLYYGSSGLYLYADPWGFNTLSSWTGFTGFDAHSVVTDPLFVNPLMLNFHLQAVSPAIDHGDSLYVVAAGETDMDTMSRIQNGRIDIGADEYGTAVGIAAHASADEARLILDRETGLLIVRFTQPLTSAATISLMSADGKLISEKELPQSSREIMFSVAALPAGVYFIYATNLPGQAMKFVR
jgi:hypothetical protein